MVIICELTPSEHGLLSSFAALFHCPPTLFLAQLRMSRSHRPMTRLLIHLARLGEKLPWWLYPLVYQFGCNNFSGMLWYLAFTNSNKYLKTGYPNDKCSLMEPNGATPIKTQNNIPTSTQPLQAWYCSKRSASSFIRRPQWIEFPGSSSNARFLAFSLSPTTLDRNKLGCLY